MNAQGAAICRSYIPNYKENKKTMNKIYDEVCGVLSRHESLSYNIDGVHMPYNQSGVKANLKAYECNKRGLLNLLRNHPNWNEDALAIIFEGTEYGTAVLSVNPCDYLLMSNSKTWRTAHHLDCEEYRHALFSYMNDGVSMIFYTINDSVKANYHNEPKSTRQIFTYHDGILLTTKKSIAAKAIIKKHNKAFGGSLDNEETRKQAGVSVMTFYKYKAELLAEES